MKKQVLEVRKQNVLPSSLQRTIQGFVCYVCSTRNKSAEGLTLLELLVSIVIIGILSALSLPAYNSFVDRARYSEAAIQMKAIKTELQATHLETGTFPRDVGTNIIPSRISYFPISGRDQIPFDSIYDYDCWRIGGGRSYIQITFFGKNIRRDSPSRRELYPMPGLYRYLDTDDYIMSLGSFSSRCH